MDFVLYHTARELNSYKSLLMPHYFKKKPHSWHLEYFFGCPASGLSCSHDPWAGMQQLTSLRHVLLSLLHNLPFSNAQRFKSTS